MVLEVNLVLGVFFFWPCHIACGIKDWTWAMTVNALSPNHWTTKEFPRTESWRVRRCLSTTRVWWGEETEWSPEKHPPCVTHGCKIRKSVQVGLNIKSIFVGLQNLGGWEMQIQLQKQPDPGTQWMPWNLGSLLSPGFFLSVGFI